MKTYNFLQFHQICANKFRQTITVHSVKQLKSKLEAFEILFDRRPEVYLSPYCNNIKVTILDKYLGKLESSFTSFETIKDFTIGIKYINLNDGSKLIIKGATEIELL